MSRWVSAAFGSGCCVVASALLTPVFIQSSLSSFAPLVFLLVIVVVAVRFGSFAGMLGTIGGALVFAVFLFEPRFSIMINDAGARNHLIWMVLIGVVVSDLLGAYSLGGTSTSKHS